MADMTGREIELQARARIEALLGPKPKLGSAGDLVQVVPPGRVDDHMRRVYAELARQGLAKEEMVATDSMGDDGMDRVLSVVWCVPEVPTSLRRLLCHVLLQDRLLNAAISLTQEDWSSLVQREGSRYAAWRRIYVEGSGPLSSHENKPGN